MNSTKFLKSPASATSLTSKRSNRIILISHLKNLIEIIFFGFDLNKKREKKSFIFDFYFKNLTNYIIA